jgi:agmatinase
MNFLNLSSKKQDATKAAAVLLPLVYSNASPEADRAAEKIFKASHLLSLWDAETGTDLSTLGLHSLEPLHLDGDPPVIVKQIYQHCTPFFKRAQAVAAVGGSHMGALGLIRAAHEEQQVLSVLHLAACPHIHNNAPGEPGEANCMAQVREKCTVAHVGIRNISKAERDIIHPDNLVFARDIHTSGLNAITDALDVLGEKIFLVIHLDVLDPAIMPAVARPEPGGLDWYTVNSLIRLAAREKIITGFSVTGMRPPLVGDLPGQLLAAKLVCKVLISILQKQS